MQRNRFLQANKIKAIMQEKVLRPNEKGKIRMSEEHIRQLHSLFRKRGSFAERR